MRARSGVTLIEVLVVLVVMSVALAVVGVTLARSEAGQLDDLSELLASGRAIAVRRAEVMYLDLRPSGEWVLRGGTADAPPAGSGSVARGFRKPVTIVFSAFGTCALDVRSQADVGLLPIDPAQCAVMRSE